MAIKDAVVERFTQIMREKEINANRLANMAGVTPSTVYSMLDPRRQEVTVNLIKKLCDGMEISIREFFDSEIFDKVEQEIK